MSYPDGMTLELIVTRSFCHFTLGFWVALLVTVPILKYLAKTLKLQNFRLGDATCVGLWGGIANTLVDIDHLALFFGFSNGKFLHTPLLWIAMLVAGYSIGCILEALDRPSKETRSGIFNLVATLGISLSVVSHVLEDKYPGWF